jgi:hypothetical protein
LGAQLAQAVTASNGVVILGVGAPLEEDQINYLIRRGVEAVTIEEPDKRDADTITREVREAHERVEQLFETTLLVPALSALKEKVLAYRMDTLA